MDVTLTQDELTAYVVDHGNNCVRSIDLLTAAVSTFAGTCTSSASTSSIGTTTSNTVFNLPRGLALSGDDAWLIVVDTNNVRKIDLATKAVSSVVSISGLTPAGLAVMGSTLYMADMSGHSIKSVDWMSGGSFATLAGSGSYGLKDAIGTAAQFYDPTGIASGFNGHILVADSQDNSIRWINLSNADVWTIAGSATAGYLDAMDSNTAEFTIPWGVALTRDGRYAVVSDQGNNRIRKINVNGCEQCAPGFTTSVVGAYIEGFCHKSLCAAEPLRTESSLVKAVDYWSQSNSSIIDANVALWLDARNVDGLHNDGLYRSDAYVTQWKDLSPYGRTFTNITADYTMQCGGSTTTATNGGMPGYLTPLGVWITPTSGAYSSGTATSLPATVTFFIAVQSSLAYATILNSLTVGGASLQSVSVCDGQATYTRMDASLSYTSASTSWDGLNMDQNYDNVVISGYVDSLGETYVMANGQKGARALVTSIASAAGSATGSIRFAEAFQGYLQEVIVVEGTLSAAQMTSVHLYLSRKWDVGSRRMDSSMDGTTDYYDGSKGTTPCAICGAGYDNLGAQCRPCMAGKFSSDGAQCVWCPGNSSSLPGSVAVSQCACTPGFYRESTYSCVLCPAGFYCPATCG
eukprot:415334-Hanusia_phi.AAC.2